MHHHQYITMVIANASKQYNTNILLCHVASKLVVSHRCALCTGALPAGRCTLERASRLSPCTGTAAIASVSSSTLSYGRVGPRVAAFAPGSMRGAVEPQWGEEREEGGRDRRVEEEEEEGLRESSTLRTSTAAMLHEQHVFRRAARSLATLSGDQVPWGIRSEMHFSAECSRR